MNLRLHADIMEKLLEAADFAWDARVPVYVGEFAGTHGNANMWMYPSGQWPPVTPAAAASGPVDMVNRPPHYQSESGIECIEALEAALGTEAFIAHCRATAIKYLWRTGKKGAAEEDLRKAVWYATRAADAQAKLDGRTPKP